ncbi:hypothetical protein ACKVMT_15285 [Halobacteriales archaeon Cl-PHB]
MFDAPLDAWFVWLALGAVSVTVAGVAVGLPSVTAPDAAGVADAVDAVAASPHEAVDTVDVQADLLKLGRSRLGLRNDAGTSHATFAYGPVTPVGDGSLQALLGGQAPESRFDSKRAFERALRQARGMAPEWRAAPSHLTVRRVSWGDVDATLVG